VSDFYDHPFADYKDHVFLGRAHAQNERKTWAVIVLCSVMMLAEIVGGSLFGSLALIADGLHMSTHAGAMLIAALAYTYARRHSRDRRFVFGTGKLGDLAGFSSAIILAMISLLIAYEAVTRFIDPVPIDFREAIPIAVVGLGVNLLSAWLLSGDHHGHEHGHTHAHQDHDHEHDPEHDHDHRHHAKDSRDLNMRAAYVHVLADAAVSVLAIAGLALAKIFDWLWMDPLAGAVGALVIANWSFVLIRDSGAVLLDVRPDDAMARDVRGAVEAAGDQLVDLHIWRLGPGHLGAVLSVLSADASRTPVYYHRLLARFKGLSHVTVEVNLR
jgi:cation diffusion facilitator family transporter